MSRTTIVQEVKKRMEEMINAKAQDMATIQEQMEEARRRVSLAKQATEDATSRLDLESYEKAVKDLRKAETKIDMCKGRIEQLRKQEYITEVESDQVIDSLLQYESDLGAGFESFLAEMLEKISRKLDEYQTAVADTEETINAWTSQIHANYRAASGTMFHDGSGYTNRSPSPIPVHSAPFRGCAASVMIEAFLRNQAAKFI